MTNKRSNLVRYGASLAAVLGVHVIAVVLTLNWSVPQAIELPPAAMMVELAPVPEPAPPPPPKAAPQPPAPVEEPPLPKLVEAPKPKIAIPKPPKPKAKPQPPCCVTWRSTRRTLKRHVALACKGSTGCASWSMPRARCCRIHWQEAQAVLHWTARRWT